MKYIAPNHMELVFCDCKQGTTCPNGIDSVRRCRIWRRSRHNARANLIKQLTEFAERIENCAAKIAAG